MFEPVGSRADFPALERGVMDLWARDGTFQESLRRRQGAPRFVFYEGPPTANGRPGTHHALSRAFKDLFGRYRTMKGFYVERKAGWDTHGLPVELEVEKALKISGKQQIEEFGVAEFNRLCRESVHRYVEAWTRFSERMAFWLDYQDAYWTLTPEYMQSVWWALRRMWDDGLIYKGFRVAPYCPRCMTPLSSHELALGYRDDTPDPSVFVRFRLAKDPKTSLLAWTTTPWTLPGNVALAVDADSDYVRVRVGEEHLIVAAARLEVLEAPYEVVDRLPGADLVDLDYEPLYTYRRPERRAFYVVAAGFVSMEEGTGVVHTAAAYGVDDLRLCEEKGIPVRHVVDLRGRFLEDVEKFAGMFVKDADPKIIEDLGERGLLYRSGTITHTYPFCWRCDTPLLYYALDSWFIRTSEHKRLLLENNAATNWVPAHIKTGRMGDWLENNIDWAFSRTRYWGTPLPFWVCDSCGAARCVGSAEEIGLAPDADLHRPQIDQVTLACECGGTMRRVPEVLDAWFDSGSMPFAQRGYPRQGARAFEMSFPADFICEALDQTRGWFYTLLAISTLLFRRGAYRNVICLGLILDEAGRKASKSRGNILDPWKVFDTYGSDAMRWLFYTTEVGESYKFGPATLQEIVRQFLLTLWNVYSFFVTYANIDGFEAGAEPPIPNAERPVLDRWLLSKLVHLVAEVDGGLDRYDVNAAARPIQAFVEDLSNWYVRRSRRRFWKSGSDRDKLAAHQTLHQTLVTLSRLLAPFMPFLAEVLHRNLTGERSVHLADFPVADPAARDGALERQMASARRAVEQGLAAREVARIKVRQPLARAELPGDPLEEGIAAIVREELNVKSLTFGAARVKLDTAISDDLRLEGIARELVRRIQDLRKRSGFNIVDRIHTFHEVAPDGHVQRALARFGDSVRAETLTLELRRERPAELDGAAFEIEGEPVWIGLRRAG
ncbi:MAG: isoleucine--tRNA ligase [Candidatus Dormibacteraceae bacterium]